MTGVCKLWRLICFMEMALLLHLFMQQAWGHVWPCSDLCSLFLYGVYAVAFPKKGHGASLVVVQPIRTVHRLLLRPRRHLRLRYAFRATKTVNVETGPLAVSQYSELGSSDLRAWEFRLAGCSRESMLPSTGGREYGGSEDWNSSVLGGDVTISACFTQSPRCCSVQIYKLSTHCIATRWWFIDRFFLYIGVLSMDTTNKINTA